jgi:RHS repeat-associated protein
VRVTEPQLAGAPAAGVIGYAYDARDNLASVTDQRGLATSYAYTGFDELSTLTSPDTGVTQYTYDAAGNVATMQDARGQAATYAYDALDRLKALTYADESLAFTYDDPAISPNSRGRLARVTDGSGSTTYGYDPQGRVTVKTQVTGAVVRSVGYAYNAAGQLATLTTPSGQALGYGYTNNQVTSITVNGQAVLSGVKYFPFGEVASWSWGNGQSYQRVYDTDGRIASVTLGSRTRAYAFDEASRITGLEDKQGATSLSVAVIGYDALDRLTSAVNSAPGGYNQGFVYDLIGNRTSQTVAGIATTLAYGATSNRLTQIGAQPIGYDAAGNITSDGTFTYHYSGRNRLVEVKQAGSTIATYRHNAFGERVAKTANGSTRLFVYDEDGRLLGEYDATGALIQETVWLEDTPVALIQPKAGGGIDIRHVWADHLDTPRAITTNDAAATVLWTWDSDPFGTTAASGSLEYNLRFPGQYFDAETGTHYNYFRDYNPLTGRYQQSDPIGLEGGRNTYLYVAARPLDLADVLGLAFKPAPRDPPIPGAGYAKPKDNRKRWSLPGGGFCEWDSQHGEWEIYDKRGRHQGVRDTKWTLIKLPKAGRKATP